MSDRLHVLKIRTPEGVAFTHRIASPVLRLAALLIDWAVVSVAWSVMAFLVALVQMISADIGGLVATLSYFLLSQGYRIVAEWRWQGRTIGKRVMLLRVVDESGLRLRFAQIVMRNLLRFVDVMPAAYLVGGLAAFASRKGQRLGDLVAGTVVIWEPGEALPDLTFLSSEKYNSLREFPTAVARLRQAVGGAEAHAAWQALARRADMDAVARVKLFAELAEHFRGITPVPAEAVEGVSDEQFVRNVVDVLFVTRSG